MAWKRRHRRQTTVRAMSSLDELLDARTSSGMTLVHVLDLCMPVQVRFQLIHDERKKFDHPPTVALSRVPCVGERVYVAALDDVTWAVADVEHRDFREDQIDAVVTLRRP